ncbi:glycoside hydrolase superfamily [Clohesyomyces aquaticus]|uniref:Alpha-galactosidase n=1 Tax=Clohesyomyces aquaticus TaxID=1231657 RepID=A0A1Y2A7E1_9PLEO|nr:glycoside hydrolase superfamily [Clohesyomyces aquaticus]
MLLEILLSLSAAVLALPSTHLDAHQLERRVNNGLGKTPALGWNSWNIGGCAYASEKAALDTGKLFVSLGLKDLGYQYVNIDDCWSTKNRDSSGNLVPDPSKFPRGMKAVTDDLHNMGLKFGLYGCAGTQTCAGYPASQGKETQDAKKLADWGVDYWKHDNCYTPCNNGNPQTCGSPKGNSSTYYKTFSNALLGSGRPILFSLCNWGRDNVWAWGAGFGNSWRMSTDIQNNWGSVASIAAQAAPIAQYAGPGGFNDLDMMQIGNNGLSENEERAHMGIWAIAKSPIILGTDLAKIRSSSLNIIKNKAILAINQDPLGKAATYFTPAGKSKPQNGKLYPYWTGPLTDGVVIGVVAADGAATLSFNFGDVPGLDATKTYNWTEAWTGTTGSGKAVSTNLGSHDMRVYRLKTA